LSRWGKNRDGKNPGFSEKKPNPPGFFRGLWFLGFSFFKEFFGDF